MGKAADAFRTISEVADELDVQKHVLRFWENKFPQLHPMKRGGGRRYYRPEDLDLLRGIQHLLRNEGYTIKGVQKILREQGVDEVKRCWQRPGGLRGGTGEGKSTSAGRKGARGEARGRPHASAVPDSASRRVIAAAIRELEVCRRVLTESTAGGTNRRASGRARQRG
ncbi:MAG TPA: MerR family transcriptional regulator [Hyphomicrobiaceae bacterium]|nr:MerR family transcriptional regulator [Hyphomicrobiaceae bacterium]